MTPFSDCTIHPCRACCACLFKEERCIRKDDLPVIQEAGLKQVTTDQRKQGKWIKTEPEAD